jgi:hypothetical protein
MILKVKTESGLKVLIIDQQTIKIISSCITMIEIMEKGVICKTFF